jgi:hypothetical protein
VWPGQGEAEAFVSCLTQCKLHRSRMCIYYA